MYHLTGFDSQLSREALQRILDKGDGRFIPVLIEVMRAQEIGFNFAFDYSTTVEAVQELSGQELGPDWPAWVEWYGATDHSPPPGFTGWKGDLFGFIDPEFERFLGEDTASTIRVEEIVWGGVRVDGIPALDRPQVIAASEAGYLLADEPVFGLEIDGEARAYPLRILDWHEMANDSLAGVPYSVAYCTLCGAAIAYHGRVDDGRVFDFGSSGLLFRSNKLMYDRQTSSLWNQLTGEPVVGELAGSGVTLEILPLVLTSWSDWVDQHPDTTVLSLETGYARNYQPGAAYGHYFSDEGTMFPVWQRGDQLATKERVFVLRLDGEPVAYPLSILVDEEVVNDKVGETNVVVVARRGLVTVDGRSQLVGEVRYEAGGEVRAYDRGQEIFRPGNSSEILIDSQGRRWTITEGSLLGPEGERAGRLGGHLAYWFGWYTFFPNTRVYSGAP
jgi:hypothetical protein